MLDRQAREQRQSRREQILETLARMLEARPGHRITTALLAAELGISEAALYRHFPSKAKMFEALIEFVEESLFSRIQRIHNEIPAGTDRCRQLLTLLLLFCERNPGITTLLNGDGLMDETHRLRLRTRQLFEQLETELRRMLRDAELNEGLKTTLPQGATAALLLAQAEGQIARFVRSGFELKPTRHWEQQWQALESACFVGAG